MLPNIVANGRFAIRMAVALLRRPDLVGTAVRQGISLVPRGWWKTSPWLPVPRPDYLEFRQVTLSGNVDAMPEPRDVLVYLEWCRSMKKLPSRAHHE